LFEFCAVLFQPGIGSFGSAFAVSRFEASGAEWVDDEVCEFVSWLRGGEPAESVHKADAVGRHALSLSGLEHGHTDQVIDQEKHGQFFQHALDGLTTQHLHPHRGLEMPKAGFDIPAQPIGRPGVKSMIRDFETRKMPCTD
jgi:hypothetical protein